MNKVKKRNTTKTKKKIHFPDMYQTKHKNMMMPYYIINYSVIALNNSPDNYNVVLTYFWLTAADRVLKLTQ